MSINTPSPVLQNLEEPQPNKVVLVQTETGSKFVWVIEKFSNLDATKHHYSEVFCVDGYKWLVQIFPKGIKANRLSVFLNVFDSGSMPNGWSRYTEFSFAIVNQSHTACTIKKDGTNHFDSGKSSWGFPSFMPLSDLKDPTKGFLVNDTCIIEAEVKFETRKKIAREVSSSLSGTSLKARNSKKISLKLLVDKKHNCVVLAESDKEFVDILLSFLTMPLGTVHRLLARDSSIGCISSLYKSVENFDSQHFQTDACKFMLLNPLNAAGRHCENLLVNIDDTEASKFYTCESFLCCSEATCSFSSVPNVKCCCGESMSYGCEWKKLDSDNNEDGVFVKGLLKFIIADDLHIMPASTPALLSLLEKLGKNDGSVLEERTVDVGHEEILNLLMNAINSNNPLTNLFFKNSAANDRQKGSYANNNHFQLIPKSEQDGEYKEAIKVNLLLTRKDNKVVHMEGGKEIVDFLFSFLTLPLGSIIKLLNKTSNLGCINNLYSSVESFCLQGNNCIKSEECKMMLLQPKLPPFFSCETQLLRIDEMVPKERGVSGCYACFRFKETVSKTNECSHGIDKAKFNEINPKLSTNQTEYGGGYAKGPNKFIISDDLHVTPLSPISTIYNVNKLGISISDLVVKDVSIGEAQALNLLKAALASKMALSCIFPSI